MIKIYDNINNNNDNDDDIDIDNNTCNKRDGKKKDWRYLPSNEDKKNSITK